MITYGVSFNKAGLRSRAAVAALTPVKDHAVWQTSQPLVVPKEMLMTRQWYVLGDSQTDDFDRAVGCFHAGVSFDSSPSKFVRGEFWISYTVELEGTVQP